jgi:hypothetical protein
MAESNMELTRSFFIGASRTDHSGAIVRARFLQIVRSLYA